MPVFSIGQGGHSMGGSIDQGSGFTHNGQGDSVGVCVSLQDEVGIPEDCTCQEFRVQLPRGRGWYVGHAVGV